MTDTLETPSFGIEETMEHGIGNQELVNDLLSPETSTENPDDVTPIDTPPAPSAKVPKKSVPAKPATPPSTDDEPEPAQQSFLAAFLEKGEDDDDEPIEGDPPAPADEPAEDDEGGASQSNSPFTAFSKDLFKLGVFTTEEGEEPPVINTPEEFLEQMNSEKKKGAIEIVNNFIGQFGEDYQEAFNAIFVKGVSPKDYYGVYNKIVNFAELDLKEERNQEAVVRQSLLDQGWENPDIDAEIERLKNYADLEAVATRNHKALVKKEAAKLMELEETSQRALQQKAAIKSQYIQNVQGILSEKLKTKEFDGIPINPKLASELQDFLLVDKFKTTSGETLTDFDRTILELKRPENHALKVKVALLLKIMEKDPTLSTIQRAGVSKKSNTVFEEVARQSSKSKTGTLGQQAKSGQWQL